MEESGRKRNDMKSRILIAVTAVIGACGAIPSTASAQMSFQSIVQIGAQVRPVTVNQSSQVNAVGILQVGGAGPSATVVQNGTNNYTGILQFGGATSASVQQSGAVNFVFIGQSDTSSTLFAQFGGSNTSSSIGQTRP